MAVDPRDEQSDSNNAVGNGSIANGTSSTNGTRLVNDETSNGTNGQHEIYTNGHEMNGAGPNGTAVNGHARRNVSQLNGTHKAAPSGQIPIAICGMACRLPGGLATPAEAWQFLLDKKDAQCRVPESRYNISAYHDPDHKPGTVATEYGFFLDDSVDLGALDASFFSLSRAELERCDPQQRMMLEVVRESLDDAGMTNWKGKNIGCYVGSFGEDWVEMFAKESLQWGRYRVTGTGDFTLSNRISYEFGITGPSQTIRTACSSALVALNEACSAINRGDCESAVVGGVNLIMAPGLTTAMQEQGVLSPTGSCKSFSADADGYARGEAATAIIVKPLADALRDGDPVRAVITATSHNSDGKTPGLSMPSTDAQEALIRRAYQLAGITDYSQTAMVECHGTGTAAGDPIETKAVARIFGDKGVYIGSVKPNLGHTEGASGLVSLIKMVKALEHRTIPPNIRFSTPNPNIPWKEGKLSVPVEPTPWPVDRAERVSINSFGVGGANAHAILESAAMHNARTDFNDMPIVPQLLLYSANSAKSLEKMIENYKTWVESHPEQIADLAYTLALRREALPHRAYAIVHDGAILNVSSPNHLKVADRPNIVFVFTGQGAQWPQMGRELLQSHPVFRASIRSLDKALQLMAGPKPTYSIEKELKKPAKTSRLSSAEMSQPMCTAVQIALVDTFKALGIVPHAVVGHSSGEIAAAYASGALSAAEAITAAHHRGAVTVKQTRKGAMAAIGMGWDEARKFLVPNVTIACDNAPNSVTISGDVDAVQTVIDAVKASQPDTLARLLQVDKAYHSYHMAEIGDDYVSLIEKEVTGRNETTSLFFSSVTGKIINESHSFDAEYWRSNLESPVRFRQALSSILEHEVGQRAVLLEIGPHSALAGPIRQISTKVVSSAAPYVAAMQRGQDCFVSLLSAVGKLHSFNIRQNLDALFPNGGSCLPELPTYPWNHQDSYWYEPRIVKEWRHRKFQHHDLLGVRVPETSESEPVFRNLLHLSNVPWMKDHKIGENIVMPFAGYIALAGEAISQLTGVSEGFSIRNIIVSTALVVEEAKPTEMITAMRPVRLTDNLNSSGWEFSVSAFNGHIWVRHCSGEVYPLSSEPNTQVEQPQPLPRKINAQRWYDNMHKGGLELGTCFQTLQTIETSTDSAGRAIGHIANGRNGDEANYHIHPTVVDGMIQILGAAAVEGFARKTKTWLPTGIGFLNIWKCSTDLTTDMCATLSSNHGLTGSGRCTSRDKVVIEASGIKMALADAATSGGSTPNTHAAARQEWGADIDFLDISTLINHTDVDRTHYLQQLERLGQLCLLSSKRRLQSDDEPASPHLRKYIDWLKEMTKSAVVDLAATMSCMDNTAISVAIEEMGAQLAASPAAPAALAIQQVNAGMNQLLSGQPLEEVLSDEALHGFEKFVSQLDFSDFIRHLTHSKPNLSILEMSTGTNLEPSRDIIKALTRPNGEALCSKYTFTTSGFISSKDHEKLLPNMEYATLDIRDDPEAQGFENQQYDLIIASNALHLCNDLQQSLANLKKLLSPTGRILLQELCPTSKWMNYVYGTRPSWWVEDMLNDKRSVEPYLSVDGWEAQLIAAGFGTIQCRILDAPEPHQLSVTIVASLTAPPKENKKNVTLLLEECDGTVKSRIAQLLVNTEYAITECGLNDRPPPGQDVISILDLGKPFVDTLDAEKYQAFKDFVDALEGGGVLWLTHSSETNDVKCRDPRFAQIIGLSRVIRSEMLVDFATCQVADFDDPQNLESAVKVFHKFHARQGDETLAPDYEFAVEDGIIKTPRFHPFSVPEELSVKEVEDKATLDVDIPGRLTSLQWRLGPREELTSGYVEVAVHSIGMNFRDILVTLGIVELPVRQLGLEAAGVVSRVGPNVDPNQLKVGDRVFCLKKHAFSTHIVVEQDFCVKIPDQLAFDEAASMLVAYCTAIHSLVNIGRMHKGQSVLIHSACGGVGLAAIQVCQMVGVELYTTVSSDEKVRFLMDNFKIPRRRIFQSRDRSFVKDILRETDGAGVDLVLNSLSGELLHATWECVAEFGSLIEIGKRDLLEGGKLDMKPFLANRSYCCVDIDKLWKRPKVLRGLMLSTLDFFVQGHCAPIRPIKVFTANDTPEAMRYMQKGQHIGKIVVAIPPHGVNGKTEATALQTTKSPRRVAFNGSASYLMVGGLGGLGRAIAVWMVEHGARELLFLSRSAGTTTKDDTFVKELQSMGCDVKLVAGDVTRLEDVAAAISKATNNVKGIFQMSMVLRDENFTKMTFEDWTTASAPKVRGTWNLHDATISAGCNLDFFILFSSLSGVIGQPGQANYASANTFLDAFAHYRTNTLGLKASVVDIGAVEEVGYISENRGMIDKMKTTGFKGITENELLDAMRLAIWPQSPSPQFVLGLGSSIPLTSASNRAVWRKDRRMASYHNVSSDSASAVTSGEALKAFLASAKADPALLKLPESTKFLAEEIGKKLFDLLLKPQDELNTSLPLTDLGLDSLVALELRAWWKQVLGFDITVLEMLGMGSLDVLGKHAAEGLAKLASETA